jgi:large conductance mechanosensitive channel
MKGFREFMLRDKVIDLAVAVVIGAAFGSLVSALVRDLLTPLIAAVGGQPDFSGIYFTINNSKFLIGDFINALISFLISATAVYLFVVAPANKLQAKRKSEDTSETMRDCPFCTNKISKAASRCPFCTSEVKPATQ